MSGHSHWSGIKHKKGLQDAKRAKIFTRAGKMITIAAREGGGKPDSNLKLKLAIEQAKSVNMPKENIERAIKRGTGELKSNFIEEITYEGVAPGGIMMIIKTATDNRNRTVSEIKTIFTKLGGKLGEVGSVMWNFEQIGKIFLAIQEKDVDKLELLAIEAGAEDIQKNENTLIISTRSKDLQLVLEKLLNQNLVILESRLAYIPKTTLIVNEKNYTIYQNILDQLKEQEDVDEIYDNL